MRKQLYAVGVLLVMVVLGSCTPAEVSVPEPTSIPTAAHQPTAAQKEELAAIFQTLPPPPTMSFVEATATVAEAPPEEATPEPTAVEPLYRVAFVAEGDVLNARSGPGVENEVVGTFSPEDSGIRITGRGQSASGSIWVPVLSAGTAGWVNSRFLSDVSYDGEFCEITEVSALLDTLKGAIDDENGEMLSEVVHPERGIRVRLNWWNPEVLLRGRELAELFSSSEAYEWGVEDGSGEAIEGAFSDVVLPMLVEDLLGATDSVCNEILRAGSAGIIQLPESYPETSYYSFHRPGTDEFGGLDWGTWVVGIERWEGSFYVSFLVHFGWEI